MASVIEAAGVVLVRRTKARGTQVCLVHRPRQNDWSLPKGKRDPGEALPATACRETVEETGCVVVLGPPLEQQRYKVVGRPKTVDYWVGHKGRGGPGFRPNKEIDRLEWLAPAKAISRLSYPRDRGLIVAAMKIPRTSPLIVVRHTSAMKRSDFQGNRDSKRPLTKSGEVEAKDLIPLLLAFGIAEVHSSDSVRCMDTVAPLAKKLGTGVVAETLFSEEVIDRKPKTALRRLKILARRPRPLVLCTHRPVLPDVFAVLAAYFGINAKSNALSPALQPGGMVVFHRRLSPRGRPDGRVVAVERYDA